MHSRIDASVPMQHAIALHEAAGEPRRIMLLDDSPHCFWIGRRSREVQEATATGSGNTYEPVILTLTLNASWDRFIVCPRFRQKKVVEAVEAVAWASGKGIDVSRALSRLGDQTVALVALGGAVGDVVELTLSAEGIPYHAVRLAAGTRANHTLTDPAGDELHIVEPGGAMTREELEALRHALFVLLERASVLVLTGSIPHGVPVDIYLTLTQRAQALGVRTVLDTRSAALVHGLRAQPWIVKPNADELGYLVGRADLTSEPDLLRAAQEVLDSGVELIVVTRGAEGALLVNRQGAWTAAPPAVAVVDTVGCGDAFLAGFLHGAIRGSPPAEALRWAVAAGTANTLAASPGGISPEEVNRLLPQVRIRPAA